MPPVQRDSARLLTELETVRYDFTPGAAARVTKLLALLRKHLVTDARQLIRFHEVLLFLRAFPQSPAVVRCVENLLNVFHLRIEKLRALHSDMSLLDDFDTSGIAGTAMEDALSLDLASWLLRRIPNNVSIAWDDYLDDDAAERARGRTWPRFFPLLAEDSAVEASIPWRPWLDAARGRQQPLAWLVHRFEQLPLSDRDRAELFDSLRIPIRWDLANLKLSRTRNWTRPRRFYFHDAPLIPRSQVSLADELACPAPKLERLSLRVGESVMQTISEVMLVRYRELYGTTLGDPRSVVRADLGRGVVMHLWNLPPAHRLPLRAYVAGFTLKNGVPINYVEAIGLCEWIEVGFNTFYTYRQGETAWIYAQALRCLCAFTGATTISIYPYQIGQENDEAIDSGAFWFYRKLGFRSGHIDLQHLCEREEKKIAASSDYRTPKKTLKRLAEAHMFYELNSGSLGFDPAEQSSVLGHAFTRVTQGLEKKTGFRPGPWDTFSTRNLALRVNRRMGKNYNGDIEKLRRASIAAVTRALVIHPARWTAHENRALENWSLVLALIPDLRRWPASEKQKVVHMIRAQAGSNEMRYLRLTQEHPRLRAALLRLGS